MLRVQRGLATREKLLRFAELAWPNRYELRRVVYFFALDVTLVDDHDEDLLCVVDHLARECPPLLRALLRQAHPDLTTDVDDCFTLET